MGLPWYESLNFLTGRNIGSFNRNMWGTRARHNVNAWRSQPRWSRWKRFFGGHWRKSGGTPRTTRDWVRKPSRMKDSIGKQAQGRTRERLRQYGMSKAQATALTRFLAIAAGTAGAYGYGKAENWLDQKTKGWLPTPGNISRDINKTFGPFAQYTGNFVTPMWKRKKRYNKIMRAIDYGYRYNRRYSKYGY